MIKPSHFKLPGGRSGVLLIHGLTGTPTEMRFVGNGLNRAGFTVHGMQLAGHCGDASDLLATGWRDWYASACEAAEELRSRVDHLFVAGLSMGALLALMLAIDRPGEVDGLGLFGTTFFYDGWTIPPIARLSFLLPLATVSASGARARSSKAIPTGSRTTGCASASRAACLPATARPLACPEILGCRWPNCSDSPRAYVIASIACMPHV